MLLDLANACCCLLFCFAFAIMCLIANAFKARHGLRCMQPLSYWNNMKEKGTVDIQVNQRGLGREILAIIINYWGYTFIVFDWFKRPYIFY